MNTKTVIGISAGLLGSTLILFGIAARMADVRIADLTAERDIYASRAANEAKQISNLIRQAYGGKIKVFEPTIPRSVRAAETSTTGESIFTYDPKGKVAEAYKSLTKTNY